MTEALRSPARPSCGRPLQAHGRLLPTTMMRHRGPDSTRALPASMADDRAALSVRLWLAFVNRDWVQAKEGIEKLNDVAFKTTSVPKKGRLF